MPVPVKQGKGPGVGNICYLIKADMAGFKIFGAEKSGEKGDTELLPYKVFYRFRKGTFTQNIRSDACLLQQLPAGKSQIGGFRQHQKLFL